MVGSGDMVSEPRYVVIETTHDEVVTPYTNAFLGGPTGARRLFQPVADHDSDPAAGGLLQLGAAFAAQQDQQPRREQDQTDADDHREANFVFGHAAGR
jgi:hypothetical protein